MSVQKPPFSALSDDLATRADHPAHTWPRLYVDQDLSPAAQFSLDPTQAHYLIHVLRAREGDSIRLFNGRDGDWKATITHGNKKILTVRVNELLHPQITGPNLILAPALIKRAHFDFVIMKATELGVRQIRPLLTERTQIRDLNLERAHAIAREAAEQSERLNIPEILAPQSLSKFLAADCGTPPLLVCAEFGEAQPLAKALIRQKETQKKPSACILTGPEGGLTQTEMQKLHADPRTIPVRLGPRILRADTAALAAMSVWQALCGDWDGDDGNTSPMSSLSSEGAHHAG